MGKFMKNKKNIILISLITIFILILIIIYFFTNKKDYQIFLDMYMPNDSYGYIVYSPGNNNEFNLYQNSYLNLEYVFSDKKERKIEYVINNNDVINIENNKIIAKNVGTSKIYIKTKDNIKSNVITINVVEDN